MPNIKSAKKRVLVNTKKAEQNKAIRSAVRTEIKKIDLLIKENKYEEAKAALANAFSVIDDYHYYYRQYLKRGWDIKVIYTYDLIDNYDKIFEKLLKEIEGTINK